MNTKKLISAIIVLSLTLSFTGCIGVNKGFREMRSHILQDLGGDYDKVMEFSIGPSGLFFAGLLTKFAETEEDVQGILKQLSRVQVGIFENNNKESYKPSFSVMKSLSSKMHEQGWKCLVRTVDKNDMVGIFIPAVESDRITQIFIVAINQDEMVMTEILGDLENIIEIAIRDHGLNLTVDSNI